MDFQKSIYFQIQVCRHSVYQAPVSGSLADTMTDLSTKRAYTRIGMYKGNIVAIKQIHKRSVDLTRSIRKELKQVIYIFKYVMVIHRIQFTFCTITFDIGLIIYLL